MSNDLYVQYHSATVVHIVNQGCKALGLEQSTFDDYKEVVKAAQDYVNHSMKSPFTERLAALDEERMALVRNIIARCRYASSTTDDNAKAASGDLRRLIVEQYPLKALNEGGERKSAFINGLVMDLEKIDEDALKALGVDALAKELQTVNDHFVQAYWARNAEYEARGQGVMLDLRQQCNALYDSLCLQINFVANRSDKALSAISDPTEREKAAAQRTLAYRFVGEQNKHIKNYKSRYLKKSASGATEEDGESAAPDAADDTGAGDTGGTNTGGATTGPTDVTEVFE